MFKKNYLIPHTLGKLFSLLNSLAPAASFIIVVVIKTAANLYAAYILEQKSFEKQSETSVFYNTAYTYNGAVSQYAKQHTPVNGYKSRQLYLMDEKYKHKRTEPDYFHSTLNLPLFNCQQ